MPRAPKHCGIGGCTVIVPNGRRCPEHANGWKNSPPTASTLRTGTRAWRETRARVLQRDNHRCQIRGPRCTINATEVDHRTPAYLGGTNDPANLQSVCHACHAQKTAQESQAARR